MSGWDVELELIDGKSKKFWRARTEGSDLHVNFGRIGTDGQQQHKSFDGADTAELELKKLAASKRKKGYADSGGAAGAAKGPVVVAAPAPVEAADDAGPASLSYQAGGRTIELTLAVDGTRLETRVVETYSDENAARAALSRIRQGLVDEGYR